MQQLIQIINKEKYKIYIIQPGFYLLHIVNKKFWSP